MQGDIYPECEHTPPCYNGVGPCYQAAYAQRELDKQRELGPIALPTGACDDANRIFDLMAITGLTDAEYNGMCSLIGTGRFNKWNPRTYEPKLDDNISFLAWATLCEVEGCKLVAHPCECGSAHCADHPHIGGYPL